MLALLEVKLQPKARPPRIRRRQQRQHSARALLQTPSRRSVLTSSSPPRRGVGLAGNLSKVGKGDKVDQQSPCAYQQHCSACYKSFVQQGTVCSVVQLAAVELDRHDE